MQEGWDFKASLVYTVNFEASLGHIGKPCLQRSRERKEGGREREKKGGGERERRKQGVGSLDKCLRE